MATATSVGYGELVLLEKRDGGIGLITFNRPEKRNAMSGAAQAEFRAALADSREDCKVLILTGSGVAFCSGVDLSEGQSSPGTTHVCVRQQQLVRDQRGPQGTPGGVHRGGQRLRAWAAV